MRIKGKNFRTVWMQDNTVKMIEQRKLPHVFEIFKSGTYQETTKAISDMVVRGAPAIGATGCYGLAQAALCFKGKDLDEFKEDLVTAKKFLQNARPTAYDLTHGLNFLEKKIFQAKTVDEAKRIAAAESVNYADKSADMCKSIGLFGEILIEDNHKILTHCNAGALATVDYGTALSPIRFAHYNKKKIFVFVDETRPRLQGANITAWELKNEHIPYALIVDNAAGYYMRRGDVDIVIVGADRVTVNGDIANKIGTYEKAVLAKENDIPFYVAAPLSTFDPDLKSGDDIPIEERSDDEVLFIEGEMDGEMSKVRIAPDNAEVRNPAFDITPAKYIKGIITEKGIISPNKRDIRNIMD